LFPVGTMDRFPEAVSVGFFGLGAMGYAMAGRLARGGFPVAVADPRCEVVERWASAFGETAAHPAHARVVITCVTDEAALRGLALGASGLVAELRPGRLLINHTAISAAAAREIAAAARARGVGFVDAPLSGGPVAAAAGTLSAMLGGTVEDVDRARAILAAYAVRTEHVGAPWIVRTAPLATGPRGASVADAPPVLAFGARR
jgi:3-hydroxyisobutyrate dehydrogenase-like beta-hydroxyacid dehydrogenase